MLKVTQRSDEEQAELREQLAAYRRDREELARRRDELLDQFPDRWIAIYAGRVFHAGDVDALFAELRSNGVDPGRVPREFLTRDKPALLL